MDFALIYRLSFSLFSFDPANMRWFNLKRLLVVPVILPLFICLLILNRLCLMLDRLFFSAFMDQKVTKPVFIIAAPRSATTYLFHLLAANTNQFTAFRLWEIIFAPSVIQKYFFLAFFQIDQKVGAPVKKSILFLEKKIFGDFIRIHQIGLSLPEEDEAILLWNMSTIYLNFFFPDTSHFSNYFAFDATMPEKQKKQVMDFYNGCVLRHNYVFNRNGTKRFLSKNPAMMAKVESLHGYYPDATILNINRCPASTIPSTLALNNHIYRFFTSMRPSKWVEEQTIDILINWYKMANTNLNKYYPLQTIRIDFKKLVTGDTVMHLKICERLLVDQSIFKQEVTKAVKKEDHQSRNEYIEFSGLELEIILKEIPFMKVYCS